MAVIWIKKNVQPLILRTEIPDLMMRISYDRKWEPPFVFGFGGESLRFRSYAIYSSTSGPYYIGNSRSVEASQLEATWRSPKSTIENQQYELVVR